MGAKVIIYGQSLNSHFLRGLTQQCSGEANVDQSNLDVFLALADDLRLKGLNGTSEEAKESKDQAPPPQEQERVKTNI